MASLLPKFPRHPRFPKFLRHPRFPFPKNKKDETCQCKSWLVKPEGSEQESHAGRSLRCKFPSPHWRGVRGEVRSQKKTPPERGLKNQARSNLLGGVVKVETFVHASFSPVVACCGVGVRNLILINCFCISD